MSRREDTSPRTEERNEERSNFDATELKKVSQAAVVFDLTLTPVQDFSHPSSMDEVDAGDTNGYYVSLEYYDNLDQVEEDVLEVIHNYRKNNWLSPEAFGEY